MAVRPHQRRLASDQQVGHGHQHGHGPDGNHGDEVRRLGDDARSQRVDDDDEAVGGDGGETEDAGSQGQDCNSYTMVDFKVLKTV